MPDNPAQNIWQIYLATDDITGTVAAAEARGTQVVEAVMPVADLGVQAELIDPTGVGPSAPVEARDASTGRSSSLAAHPAAASWFGLFTTDYDTAKTGPVTAGAGRPTTGSCPHGYFLDAEGCIPGPDAAGRELARGWPARAAACSYRVTTELHTYACTLGGPTARHAVSPRHPLGPLATVADRPARLQGARGRPPDPDRGRS